MTTKNIEMNEQSNFATAASTRELDLAAKSNDKLSAIAVIEKNPPELAVKLDDGIINRWIPYGVKKNASLIARKVEKEDLIAAIRRLNPDNAEYIIQTKFKDFDDNNDEIRTVQHHQKIVEIRS